MTPADPHIPGDPEVKAGCPVLLAFPVRDDGEILLPLVTIVVHIDIVERPGRACARPRRPPAPRAPRQMRRARADLSALVQHVVELRCCGGPGSSFRFTHRARLQRAAWVRIRVAAESDRAELEAAAARDRTSVVRFCQPYPLDGARSRSPEALVRVDLGAVIPHRRDSGRGCHP